MLDEVNQVTLELQRKHYTLAECRNAMNIIIDSVRMESENEDSSFYQCRLGTDRIEINSPIVTHTEFESAGIKIQKGEEDLLTNAEKETVTKLRPKSNSRVIENQRSNQLSMAEKISRSKRQLDETEKTYQNLNFILDTIADAERLFSKTRDG